MEEAQVMQGPDELARLETMDQVEDGCLWTSVGKETFRYYACAAHSPESRAI